MARKKPETGIEKPSIDESQSGTGRFAYDGLERVIHEKARLGIMASLVTHQDGVLFGELKEFCSLTDGNLNRHLKVLQEAGMVEIWKGSRANRPQTLCRVTPIGKQKFVEYVAELERVIADAARLREASASSAPMPRVGWTMG